MNGCKKGTIFNIQEKVYDINFYMKMKMKQLINCNFDINQGKIEHLLYDDVYI